MATDVLFNGYLITDRFIVSDLTRGFAKRDTKSISVPGMDGAIFGSSVLAPIEVSMTVSYVSNDEYERQSALNELAEVLNVSEPEPLYIPPGRASYYLAVPSGGDLTRYVGAESFKLTFTVPDPVMYGHPSKTVRAFGTLTVGGNYRTYPSFSMPSATAAGGILGISVNGGTFDIPIDDSSPHAVIIDCSNRTVTVDGTSKLPTIGSDWPVFEPGSNTAQLSSGTGTVTINYHERWFR